MPPPHKPPQTVHLSEPELQRVQAYADKHGLNLEDACTQLVRSAIKSKFVIQRPPSRVLSFPQKVKL